MKNFFYNPMEQLSELHPEIYKIWKDKNPPKEVVEKKEEDSIKCIEKLCDIFNQEESIPLYIDSSAYKKACFEAICHQKLVSLFPNFSESPYIEFHQWLFQQADIANETLQTDYFQKLALKMYRCKTLQRRAFS